MFLCKLLLNPRHRAVRRDLSDRYQLHRTVMSLFPDAGGRAKLQVLFRLEVDGAAPVLYVQSAVAPDLSRFPDDYVLPDWIEGVAQAKGLASAWDSLQQDQRLRFRLQANPTRQRFVRGGRGKTVALRSEADLLGWLEKRADASGFALQRTANRAVAVQLRPLEDVVGWRRSDGGARSRITLGATQFDGRLRVTDLNRFRLALAKGVGGGRAWGLGLLSIAP